MERVADVGLEDGDARAPLGGFFDDLDKPDATLAVALARVVEMCAEATCAISATELAVAIAVCDASGADAAVYSDRVRSRGARTPGGIAALQMYTLEFRGPSVFAALNEALRSKVRAKCAPFRRYIWMLMHAMREAPAFEGPTVYRGVREDREDLRPTYKKGRTVTWHGFSSCTSSLEVLQSEQFCGASEQRTLFIIALTQGRARWIADVSMVETEDEVLLPPNTRVRVDSTLDAGNGLVLVGLTELEPLDPILLFGTPIVDAERGEAAEAERGDEAEAVEALEAERSEEADAVDVLDIEYSPPCEARVSTILDVLCATYASAEGALAGISRAVHPNEDEVDNEDEQEDDDAPCVAGDAETQYHIGVCVRTRRTERQGDGYGVVPQGRGARSQGGAACSWRRVLRRGRRAGRQVRRGAVVDEGGVAGASRRAVLSGLRAVPRGLCTRRRGRGSGVATQGRGAGSRGGAGPSWSRVLPRPRRTDGQSRGHGVLAESSGARPQGRAVSTCVGTLRRRRYAR